MKLTGRQKANLPIVLQDLSNTVTTFQELAGGTIWVMQEKVHYSISPSGEINILMDRRNDA